MSNLVSPEPNVVIDLVKVFSEWNKFINEGSMKLIILPIQKEERSRTE